MITLGPQENANILMSNPSSTLVPGVLPGALVCMTHTTTFHKPAVGPLLQKEQHTKGKELTLDLPELKPQLTLQLALKQKAQPWAEETRIELG